MQWPSKFIVLIYKRSVFHSELKFLEKALEQATSNISHNCIYAKVLIIIIPNYSLTATRLENVGGTRTENK